MLEWKMPGLDSRATVPGPTISPSRAWWGRWRQTDLRRAPVLPHASRVILDKSLNFLGTVSSSIKWADHRTRSEGSSTLVRMQRMRAITTQHSLHVSHYYQDAVLQQKLAQAPHWPLPLYPQRHCPMQGALCWVVARGAGATEEIHAGVFHA